MSLTVQERNLVLLYHSGSREDTAAQIREALPFIDEPDINAAAVGVIAKLEGMSYAEFVDIGSTEAAL